MLDWISSYAEQSLLTAIFLFALLESLAFVGAIVPGVALLASLSWLAGQQGESIPALLLCGFIGAVAGDSLSFALGRHSAHWIAHRRVLQRHPHWLDQGQQFFKRYGGSSIFLGRFVGPIRAVIPFIAGSCAMPPQRFLLFNILSALCWAPVYLLPGYWLGEQASALDLSWNIWVQLTAGTLMVALLFHATHRQLEPGRWLSQRFGHNRWYHPEQFAIQLFLATNLIFLIGLIAIRTQPGVTEFDAQLLQQLNTSDTYVYRAAVTLTLLGDPLCLLGFSTIIALHLWQRSNLAITATFLGLLAAAILTNLALKYGFAWPRPETGALLYDSHSFPSTHTTGATACLSMLAILLALPRTHACRRLIYLGFLTLILAVALSRTVLGVHWPLDVAAGVGEGFIFAALFRWYLVTPHRASCVKQIHAARMSLYLLTFALLYLLLAYPDASSFYASAS